MKQEEGPIDRAHGSIYWPVRYLKEFIRKLGSLQRWVLQWDMVDKSTSP